MKIKLGIFFEKTQNRNPTENIFIDILYENFECELFDASRIDDSKYVKEFIRRNDIFLPHLFLFRYASNSPKKGNYPYYSENYNRLIENGKKVISFLSKIDKPVCCFNLRSDWYPETEKFWQIIPSHFYIIGGIQKGYLNYSPEEDVFFSKMNIRPDLGNKYFSDDKLIPFRHIISSKELLKKEIKKKYDFSVLGVLYKRRKEILELAKKRYKVYNPALLLRLRKMLNSFNKKYHFSNKLMNYLFQQALAKSKISYTDGSTLDLFVRKYLEIPAKKALLLCHPFAGMEDYGFIENIHYVSCNKENFYDKMDNLLSNSKLRNEIIENAFNLVKEKFTEEYTAKKLIEIFSAMKEGNFKKCYYKKGEMIVETK